VSFVNLLKINGPKSKHATLPALDQYRTAAERRADGKALRDTVPRQEYGGWKPPKDRRDPVAIVLASNEGRMPDLIPIRHGRMQSASDIFLGWTQGKNEKHYYVRQLRDMENLRDH
jgi:hypothetical protein